MPAVAPILDDAFVAAFRAGTLTAGQAEAALPRDRAVAIFFLLQLSTALGSPAPASDPHTPPGTVPPYAKPSATPRRKKRGAVPGHPGAARPRPEHIGRRETHRLTACPDCGGELARTGRTRTRLVEDIPDDLRPEVTERTIHRDWCPCCKKQVEPTVPDALPNCTLGNRTVVLSAWLHYGLGVTTRQVVEVFNGHLRLPITDGGLTQMWHRLARVLGPWYEQIHRHCLDAGVLHADETGWRVEGRTWWQSCFTCTDATYYLLDPSRGHPALDQFFVEEFRGVLVTDFWAAYDAVGRVSVHPGAPRSRIVVVPRSAIRGCTVARLTFAPPPTGRLIASLLQRRLHSATRPGRSCSSSCSGPSSCCTSPSSGRWRMADMPDPGRTTQQDSFELDAELVDVLAAMAAECGEQIDPAEVARRLNVEGLRRRATRAVGRAAGAGLLLRGAFCGNERSVGM